MIPRKFRLPSRTKLLSSLFFQTSFFSIKAAKNNSQHNRYAFIVSKKVDTRAVVRNRLRRVLREVVWQEAEATVSSKDILVVVKKNFLNESRAILTQEVKNMLAKLPQ